MRTAQEQGITEGTRLTGYQADVIATYIGATSDAVRQDVRTPVFSVVDVQTEEDLERALSVTPRFSD